MGGMGRQLEAMMTRTNRAVRVSGACALAASAALAAGAPFAGGGRPALIFGAPIPANATVKLDGLRWAVQNPSKPWSLRPVAGRQNMLAFEVRGDDHLGNEPHKNRSEVALRRQNRLGKIPYDQDVWAAGSVAIQSDAVSPERLPVVIHQVHDTPDPGEYASKSPPFALRFYGRDLYLTVQGDLAARSVGNSRQQRLARLPDERRTRLDEPPLFHDWVVRLKFSRAAEGEVDFWWNGQLIYSGKGLKMGYNNIVGGYWKYGIYRARSTPETLRVIHANVEISEASLRDRVRHPRPTG